MRNVVDTTHRRRWTATIVLVVVAQILLLSLIAILVDAFAVTNNKHHNHHLPLHRHCHNNAFFRGQKHYFHATSSTSTSTLLQPRSSSSSSLVVGMLIRPSSLSSSQPYALTSIVDTCTRSSTSTSTSTTSTTSSRPSQCPKLSRRQPIPHRRLGRGLFSTALDDQEQPNDETLKKKKKESVIEKIERKYFSDQMESRFLRIILYPLKILIWKPLRMIMKFFINHSDKEEDKTMVVDVDVRDSSSSSSKSKSNTVNISAPQLKMIPLEREIEDNSNNSIATVNSDTATNDDTTTTTSSISTDDISSSTSAPKVIISEEADDTSIAVVTSDNATNNDMATTISSIDISSSSSSSAPKLIISEETDDTSIAVVTSDNSMNDDTTTPSSSTSDVVGAEVDIGVVVPTCPKGDRWAVSAPDVDLSGRWELIITPEFKKKYDTYLKRLGQPMLVRSVALSQPVLSQTNEKLTQTELGRSLLINGKNIRGTWDRTLIASGTSLLEDDYSPLQVPIMTVDSEQVEAESWWEDQGKVHMSYLRGVTMYGGGSFVSRRYFEEQMNNNDDEVYVCESAFEFNDIKKEPNKLAWRFCRQK